VTATRARRSAFTLGVLAAMAAPLVTGGYDPEEFDPVYRYVPLTAGERAPIIALWGENTDITDCKQLAKREMPGLTDLQRRWIGENEKDREMACFGDLWRLKTGHREPALYLSLSKYIAINGAVMLAVLTVTLFALTAAMAAVRKWWRW